MRKEDGYEAKMSKCMSMKSEIYLDDTEAHSVISNLNDDYVYNPPSSPAVNPSPSVNLA